MIRPCFIVIDREFPGSISTRKLVLETAKFNVITAYSGREALEIIKRFPAVDGIVMDGEMEDVSAEELCQSFRKMAPHMPIIVISPPGGPACSEVDFRVDSFQPGKLLDTLRGLKPKEAEQIWKHDEELSQEKLPEDPNRERR